MMDNNSLYCHYTACEVSGDIKQIRVDHKSYGKTYRDVHRIYYKNKNRIIALPKLDELKLETYLHINMTVAAIK